MKENHLLGKLFWSVAFPGFGQLLNGKYIKGSVLIALEFLINSQAHFNTVILYSFQGRIEDAVHAANYQWLMFYPCIYMFAIWDTYWDANKGNPPDKYAFLPFVFAAYFVTIGLMYSPVVKIFGILLGPLWLPMLFCGIGVAIGKLIQRILISAQKKHSPNDPKK